MKNYTYFFGRKEFVFLMEVPQEVPVAVALILKNKVDKKRRKPLFKVEDMPEIIESAPQIKAAPIEQNVSLPRQQRFGSWDL